ncbi:SWIM zinc finger family protein [Streptomyces sp. KLOTTS4A1]|uniref:SWIM zinc finger family protein n=1 Tax=Streptomyces sp. KLOTTS4A1 TaxID=3390996 RepID=UPI0039F5669F
MSRPEGHEADEARAALRAARDAAHREERAEQARAARGPARPRRTRGSGGGPRTAAADLAGLLQTLGHGGVQRSPDMAEALTPDHSTRHTAPTPDPARGILDTTEGAARHHDARTASPAPGDASPPGTAAPASGERPRTAEAAPASGQRPRTAAPPPAPDHHPRTAATAPAPPRRTRDAASGRAEAAPARTLPVQDLRRTFSALPQRPTREGDFADTWWGNAWVHAMEEVAADPARVKRGRAYADQGHVEAITVTPGSALAYVQGSRRRPYRTRIRLRTLDEADWERFLDAAADHPGHLAALLDRELPHGLADLADDLGVDLLPGPGDLQPDCSCPDSGHPCKHAAALCYQTARLLDTDPFVLLLLRGRGEHWLLDTLARRNAHRAARAEPSAPAMPSVRAAEALDPRPLPPLPPPLPTPAQPGPAPAYPAAPGGPDPLALDQLATDAAARAHTLLTTGEDPVAALTLWQDAVRIAAGQPGSGLTGSTRALYARLAAAAGRSTTDLARAVAAWRQGGLDGLAVLEEAWNPPAGPFDQARPALLAAEHPPFRPRHNHLTHPAGHLQLRYGRDGYWYPYESEAGREDWWPRGTRDLDPVGALSGWTGDGMPS